MEAIISYKGNKHEYFEKKVYDLVDSYLGETIHEFKFEPGGFFCEVHFKSNGQLENFKKEVIGLSKYYLVETNISGIESI